MTTLHINGKAAASMNMARWLGWRRLLGAVVLAAGLPLASGATPFAEWSESFAADWVRQSAEWATSSQYFAGEEQAALDRELTPYGPATRARRAALARQGLKRLDDFADHALSPDDRVGAGILRWSLHRTLNGLPFEDHSFVFSQLGSPHVRYVNILAQSAINNDIVVGLARRSGGIEGWSAADRQAAIEEATTLVQERLHPAYLKVLALLDELYPRTTLDAGLWRLPQGEQAYAQALAEYTTTTMGPDEIHALGLKEVARIEAQMDQVLKGQGRAEGSVEQRMQALRLALQPAAEPDPRPGILARYAAAVKDAERRSQDLFNLQPRASIEVRRVPALTERTASADYTTPTPDGSRPGIFWAPLPGPNYDMLRIRSLAVHEAVPGHHFQLALQQEQAELPRWRQRRIFSGGSAHSEGWALYAERLALDHGWYDGDPHAMLGGLDGQLFRARRLVVDTGLHAKRWTREQAIAYGLPAREIERYVSNPGQATAYMVGMLHILALREEAQKAMGPRFTLKGFHDVVLKTGSVPLDVLSDVVRRWATTPP